MQRFLKNPLLIISTFFLVFGLGFLVYSFTGKGTVLQKEKPVVLGKNIDATLTHSTVVINYGDNNTISYTQVAGKTAYDVLSRVTAEHNIKLDAQKSSFGMFIKTIGEKTNTKDLAWLYFVNGKSADVASDSYLLHNGDIVEWKYIKPNF